MLAPPIGILGTGSYVPKTEVTNSDLEKIIDTSDEWIRQRTGIEKRRYSTEKENTYVMGAYAALQALADARISPEDVDEVIVATNSTGEFSIPNAAFIIQSLISAKNAGCHDVGAGCSGGIRAIESAVGSIYKMSLLDNKQSPKVLVIATDTLSSVLNFEDRSTCVLLADGAGALVLGTRPEPELLAVNTYAKGEGTIFYRSNLQTGIGLETVSGAQRSNMQRRPCFNQDGQQVFKFASSAIEDVLRKASEQLGLDPRSFYHVFHQANERILMYAAKRCGIPIENIYVEGIRTEGNTSAASYLIGLDHAVRSRRINYGDIVALTSVGAGLSWGTCIFRWGKTEPPRSADVSIDDIYAKYQEFVSATEAIKEKTLSKSRPG